MLSSHFINSHRLIQIEFNTSFGFIYLLFRCKKRYRKSIFLNVRSLSFLPSCFQIELLLFEQTLTNSRSLSSRRLSGLRPSSGRRPHRSRTLSNIDCVPFCTCSLAVAQGLLCISSVRQCHRPGMAPPLCLAAGCWMAHCADGLDPVPSCFLSSL